MEIRAATPADIPAILRVYAEGMATGQASFEETPGDSVWWDKKFLPECRLVAEENATILGWAAIMATSSRPVYRGVVEESLYIAESARGHGIGRALLSRLITATEAEGIWMLQAGIFPENTASLALHRALGFRDVGRRERIGFMEYGPHAGEWRDVILLERRSRVAGA